MVCDGSLLPFKTNSFDLCIEKGTIDAVMCGEDLTLPKMILKESQRVCKNNVLFITHKEPQFRGILFKDLKCKIRFVKQSLSDEADLINCMRAQGKKMSLKELMNDIGEFKKALSECILKSLERKNIKKIIKVQSKRF